MLKVHRHLTRGTPGECMPVVARLALVDRLFDDDMRGHDLLGYLRITAARGPAMLSNAVVRRYGPQPSPVTSPRAAATRICDGSWVYQIDAGIWSPTAAPAGPTLAVFYKIASILK